MTFIFLVAAFSIKPKGILLLERIVWTPGSFLYEEVHK